VLGPTADDLRRQKVLAGAENPFEDHGPALQTFGLYRLTWPRQTLLERCSRRLCRRLVDRWMAKDSRPVAEAVKQWSAEQWEAAGMRPENLIARVHELCAEVLRQPAEKFVTDITGPLGAVLRPPKGKSGEGPSVGPFVAAMADLERLLGVPEECRLPGQSQPEPGTIESALIDASAKLADQCEQSLAEQVVRLIEDPNFRLAGAEEALRQFNVLVERSLQAQETLANELSERAALLYQRVQQALESPAPATSQTPNTSLFKLSFGRKSVGPEAAGAWNALLELVRQYPKTRYHALVLHHINRLYVGLRGQLSDQLREVGFCRQRLGELAGLVQPADLVAKLPARPQGGHVRVLLPLGCKNLDDTLELIERNVTPDDLIAFDQRIQAFIRHHFRALVQVCMGSSALVRTLAPAMIQEAQRYLEPRFRETSVTELFLAQKSGTEAERVAEALDELRGFYDEARPGTDAPAPETEIGVALIPDDAKGRELQSLLRARVPELTVVPTERLDEVVFYREQARVVLTELAQLGPAARDAYQKRLAADSSAVHSRLDVLEWQQATVVRR
jgi:hypothetical protein